MFAISRTLLVPLAMLAALAIVAPVAASAEPLVALPPAKESFDVGTLHVDRYGNGTRALILVPGLGSGPWVWGGTIGRFGDDYDIYAVTLPGFDGRAAAKDEPSLFAAFDRDLAQMIATRKLERPIVVGHSLGGTLALSFAETNPTLPSAIVAVEGLPVFPSLANASPDARKRAAAAAGSSLAALTPAELQAYDQKYMSGATTDPDIVGKTAALEARSDPHAEAAWLAEDLATDLRAGLAKIAVPVLEIVPYDAADRSKAAPYSEEQKLDFYRQLLSGTKNLTVVPIPDARHFAMLDRPNAFDSILSAFFSKVR